MKWLGNCGEPGSLRTSTLSSQQISRWSKREGNFHLRGLVCCSQCPSSAMLRGRRFLTAASAGVGLRYESSPEGHGLLVDSSGRSIIPSRPLLCCISLRKVAARALRVRMATLRRGVPLRWPDWWTPVGVAGCLGHSLSVLAMRSPLNCCSILGDGSFQAQ